MKKIILTLALAISSICTFAQKPVELVTYKNKFGPWNARENHYVFEPRVYANITFSFYDHYISVNDVPHSIYRITEDLPITDEDGCKTTKCKCLDEQNKECLFYLVSFTDCRNSYIQIYYKEFTFIYTLDNEL
jgi:hypothetical protein